MFIQDEINIKKQKLRVLMEELDLDGIYIKKQHNFSWLTGGGLNVVGITLELGVAGLLITRDKEYAICNNIEFPRMLKEELLEEQGYFIKNFLWYNNHEYELVKDIIKKGRLGADYNFPGAINVSDKINPLRYSLTQWEVERYKRIGDLASLAIEETTTEIRPGDKECSIVGKLASRLWENRLDYVTTFCAADDRISLFRHPIATEKKIEKRAMLCVNARREGLIVSLTRFIQFGNLSQEIRKKYNVNVLIDCTMMAHTIPGKPVVEAFKKGIEVYKEIGYSDEYMLHHQGGAIGYLGRDYKVQFDTKEIVQKNQAFTWNPSITGSKSEDTIIATTEGPLLITYPKIFPFIKIEVAGFSFFRPDILVI